MCLNLKSFINFYQVALVAGCGRCNITALQDKKEMLNFYECHKAINLTKSEAWHFFRMNQDSMANFVKGLVKRG